MVEARAVKFCTQVDFIKSNQIKLPQKGRGYGHVLAPRTISPEWLKLETSNFVQWFARRWFSIGITLSLEWVWPWSHDISIFGNKR